MYLEPYWTLDPTRALVTNGRYLFIVVGPTNWTAAQIQEVLEQRGWDVRSTGVPPPGLASKLEELRQAGINPVSAIRVIGVWTGPNTVLPERESPLAYGAIWQEFKPEGPAAPQPGSPGTTGKPQIGVRWIALGALSVAAILLGPRLLRR